METPALDNRNSTVETRGQMFFCETECRFCSVGFCFGCDFFVPFSARLGFCTCVLTWLTVEYFNHCKRCARNVIVPLFMNKCPKCRVSIKMFRRTLLRSELPLTVPSHQTLRVLFSRRQQAALSHFISVRQGLSIVFHIFLRGLHFAQTYLSS